MKNRRKMYQDIYPRYSPAHLPVFTSVGCLLILLLAVLFFAFRYYVMTPQETEESIKNPVEVQQEAPRNPSSE